MDPNHSMDETLKSYASRRREEAGDSFELHPATRKMLQSEVAKTFPAPPDGPAKQRAWLGIFGPRLVFASGIFAVLLVLSVVLFQDPKVEQMAGLKPTDHKPDSILTETPDPAAPGLLNDSLREIQLASESGVALESKKEDSLARNTAPIELSKQKAVVSPTPTRPRPDGISEDPGKRQNRLVESAVDESAGISPSQTKSAPPQLAGADTRFHKLEAPVLTLKSETDRYAFKDAGADKKAASEQDALNKTRESFELSAANAPEKKARLEPQTEESRALREVLSRDFKEGTLREKQTTVQMEVNRAATAREPAASTPLLAPQIKLQPAAPAEQVALGEPADRKFNIASSTGGAAPSLQTYARSEVSQARHLFFSQDKRVVANRFRAEKTEVAERPADALRVLTEFEFKVEGTLLTLIDSDGSAYVGSIIPAALSTPTSPARAIARGAADEREVRRATQPVARETEALSTTASLADGKTRYEITVSGTNRTLNQLLTFKGLYSPSVTNALPPGNPASGPQAESDRSLGAAAAAPSVNLPANQPESAAPRRVDEGRTPVQTTPPASRIEGRAQVGAKTIEIRATETSPR